MKLLKVRLNLIFNNVKFFYCGSVVTTNVLEQLLTSTKQNLINQFIRLRHPGTFSKNLEINCKIVCYSNVSDLMCIYCPYRRLRTHYSLDMSRFHQIYDFTILHHPGTFMVVQNKKSYLATIMSIKLSFQLYHYKHLVT